jgi:uncharacterized membrane protein YfcA
MSVRRLPPGDNPFRPLRCRDVTLLALAALVLAAAAGARAGSRLAARTRAP